MRRFAFLLLMMLSVLTLLPGCQGSLVRSAYNQFATPDINSCPDMEGKSPAEIEKMYGKPDGIKRSGTKETRKYSKGSLKISVEFDNGKAISTDCNND